MYATFFVDCVCQKQRVEEEVNVLRLSGGHRVWRNIGSAVSEEIDGQARRDDADYSKNSWLCDNNVT